MPLTVTVEETIVMQPKTLYRDQHSFTLVELTIVLAILCIISAVVYVNTNPSENKEKARDNKRLSDMQTIERYIDEYMLDNKYLPDTPLTLRISNVLPFESEQVQGIESGWIPVDFSEYGSVLPTDPLNDGEYIYTYVHNGSSYELNSKLEYNLELMQSDGGNDPNMYEVGTNLCIISP